MRKKVALYCRVSTSDRQTVENQLKELERVAANHDWDIVARFKDEGISGAKGRDKRPGFNELYKGIQSREFDMVATWAVDRLGRSLQELLVFLGELEAKGVDIYLHRQGLDTSTPAGKMMFQMLGVFAEFERSMIQERVKAGLERAKAQGKVLGRRKVPAEIEQKIMEARAQGKGILKIARELCCGTGTVQRVVAQS